MKFMLTVCKKYTWIWSSVMFNCISKRWVSLNLYNYATIKHWIIITVNHFLYKVCTKTYLHKNIYSLNHVICNVLHNFERCKKHGQHSVRFYVTYWHRKGTQKQLWCAYCSQTVIADVCKFPSVPLISASICEVVLLCKLCWDERKCD